MLCFTDYCKESIQWSRMKTAPYVFSIKWLVHKPAFFLECLAGVKHASKFLAFSHQLMWVLRLPKSSSHPCAQRGCKTASPQTFFTLKKSILCSRFSNFDATKTLRAGSFAAPWCTRMTSTFLGTSKLILNGVRGPRSLLHVECPPDSLEKCWFTYYVNHLHNKIRMGCRFHPVYVITRTNSPCFCH